MLPESFMLVQRLTTPTQVETKLRGVDFNNTRHCEISEFIVFYLRLLLLLWRFFFITPCVST